MTATATETPQALRLPAPSSGSGRRRNAACRDQDPDLFFSADGERESEREYREAEANRICSGCPVARECIDYAVRANVRYGTWAGVNVEDISRDRRRSQERVRGARRRTARRTQPGQEQVA